MRSETTNTLTESGERLLSFESITRFEHGISTDSALEIEDDGEKFNIYTRVDDGDYNSSCVDVPRDQMFDLHAWLTRRLWGS